MSEEVKEPLVWINDAKQINMVKNQSSIYCLEPIKYQATAGTVSGASEISCFGTKNFVGLALRCKKCQEQINIHGLVC